MLWVGNFDGRGGDYDARGRGFRCYEWGNQMLGAGNSDATGGIQILWVAGGGFRC